MEISQINLIDGTVFKVGEYRFGGSLIRIYAVPGKSEVLIQIEKREKPLHIPYHSILFYLEM